MKMPISLPRMIQKLRGPSGLVLTFTSNFAEQEIAWEPEPDMPQNELEVRMRVLALTAPAVGTIPIWQWRMIFGHSTATWSEPSPFFFPDTGLFTLPARGCVFRINAREFRIRIAMTGSIDFPLVGPFPFPTRSVVQISIQPCAGMHTPRVPYQQLIPDTPALPFAWCFPADAHEYRVRTLAGLPFPAATNTIAILGLNTLITPATDAALLADWQPIPHDGLVIGTTEPTMLDYR